MKYIERKDMQIIPLKKQLIKQKVIGKNMLMLLKHQEPLEKKVKKENHQNIQTYIQMKIQKEQ